MMIQMAFFMLKHLKNMEEEKILLLGNLYTMVWEEIVFYSSVTSNYYDLVKPHFCLHL